MECRQPISDNLVKPLHTKPTSFLESILSTCAGNAQGGLWFSGSAHVRNMALREGIDALSFEINDDHIWQDMTSAHGLVQALVVHT